jgi:hypothetical protein
MSELAVKKFFFFQGYCFIKLLRNGWILLCVILTVFEVAVMTRA